MEFVQFLPAIWGHPGKLSQNAMEFNRHPQECFDCDMCEVCQIVFCLKNYNDAINEPSIKML